jgi:glycosyltransferase involved in cell wall biosynthesis
VKRTLTISVDQLFRRHPGGIGTYVQGLAEGLASLDEEFEILGVGPRGSLPSTLDRLPLRFTSAGVPLNVLAKLWPLMPLGVARDSTIVHATSMTGPFAGGMSGAVHSVAMHDLLWRDQPQSATRRGIKFHEARLTLIRRREDLRIFTTSPTLAERLIALGVASSRIHFVRLGVDEHSESAASEDEVATLLHAHGVTGPYTLYAGTREPRKNIGRLIDAHNEARRRRHELGPLVLVGPEGWGGVDTADAIVLGSVERALLWGLYRDAGVFAYVPLSEGWGLPPVEALHAGTRVVASATVPSVATNAEVILVDPLSTSSMVSGLCDALDQDKGDAGAKSRMQSVAHLTWRNSALDHVAGWQ